MNNLSILEEYSKAKGWYPDEDAHGRFVSNFLKSEPHDYYMHGLITMSEAENQYVLSCCEEDRLIAGLKELLKS